MKHFVLFCILLAQTVFIGAVEANEFLIGTFSQYQLRYAGSDCTDNFEDLANYLHDANYNAVMFGMSNHDGDFLKLQPVLDILDGNSIRTILNDQTWYPGSYIGAGALCFGNRIQIEAEYQYIANYIPEDPRQVVFEVDDLGITPEQEFNDALNFVSRHDTGNRLRDFYLERTKSNDYAWVCDSDSGHVAGIALSQLTKRWLRWDNDLPLLLGRDFRFHGRAVNENKMYLTVALRFSGVPQDDPVADIKLKFLNPSISSTFEYDPYGYLPESYMYEDIDLTPVTGVGYGTTITGIDYPLEQDEWENYLFEYYIDLDQIINSSNTYVDPETNNLYHICPEVYWHGTGKLEIDYIVLEDELSRSVRKEQNQSDYATRVGMQLDRITAADPNQNILYQFGLDEPRPGQIEMYSKVQVLLSQHSSQKELFTVTN